MLDKGCLRGRPDCLGAVRDGRCEDALPSSHLPLHLPFSKAIFQMPPTMFKLKKPGSVLGSKIESLEEGNKENRTPTLQEGKAASIDHALTIPRLTRPHNELLDHDGGSAQATPCFLPSTTVRSRSDPVPKVLRNVTNTIGRAPRMEPEVSALLVEIANSQKGTKKAAPCAVEPSSQLSPVKSKKRVKAQAQWSYTADQDGCAAICKDLGLSMEDNDFNCPIDVFHYLERSSKTMYVHSSH